MARLAHLSDLHFGLDRATVTQAEELVATLLDLEVEHTVVTGDVTHRGLAGEYEAFRIVFAPLAAAGRLSVIPGNHDRLGDNIGAAILGGERVRLVAREGLHLVCLDSTGPHNRSIFRGHGSLSLEDLDAVDAALAAAPASALTVLALHHHPLPLPEECMSERLSSFFGWPFAAELDHGAPLLRRVLGRCDLVLHGHRHVPSAFVLSDERPLAVYNAGSSTKLGRFRLFTTDETGAASAADWIVASGFDDDAPQAVASR